MPRANIFIRKENEQLWSQINNKSEFINALLTKQRIGQKTSHESIGRLQDEVERRVIKTKEDALEAVKPIKKPEPVTYTKAFPTA